MRHDVHRSPPNIIVGVGNTLWNCWNRVRVECDRALSDSEFWSAESEVELELRVSGCLLTIPWQVFPSDHGAILGCQ